jgi:hypothetical protein
MIWSRLIYRDHSKFKYRFQNILKEFGFVFVVNESKLAPNKIYKLGSESKTTTAITKIVSY